MSHKALHNIVYSAHTLFLATGTAQFFFEIYFDTPGKPQLIFYFSFDISDNKFF